MLNLLVFVVKKVLGTKTNELGNHVMKTVVHPYQLKYTKQKSLIKSLLMLAWICLSQHATKEQTWVKNVIKKVKLMKVMCTN